MKIIANKWSWLLILVLAWTAAGFAIPGGTDDGQPARAAARDGAKELSMKHFMEAIETENSGIKGFVKTTNKGPGK